MSEFRGFVFDVDKTAIPNGAATVESQPLKEAFRKLPSAVIAIAATGRSPEFALPITRELGLKHESIVANGALIVDSRSGDIRWHRLLSEEQVAKIIAVCKEYDYRFWMTGDDVDDERPANQKEAHVSAAAFLNSVPTEDAHVIHARLLEVAGVNAYLSPSWGGEENHFDINIGHIGASKSKALTELYDRYSINPSEMIGVGDGINDIELFEAVGHRVAVANAHPQLIELADEIVPAQEEDGLVRIIERFYNSGDIEEDQLKIVPTPELFHDIRFAITRAAKRKALTLTNADIKEHVELVDGFEDVLDEPLGAGYFYNTTPSVSQLIFALSVAPKFEEIVEIINTKDKSDPAKVIKALRDRQVLCGQRILDLGCGMKPGFALAAKALGAEVYTVDGEDLDPGIKSKLDGHIVADLNHKDVIAAIRQATGGNFDVVTENIIGQVPMRPIRLEGPEDSTIKNIGQALTKEGGYVYSTGHNILIRPGALQKVIKDHTQ